MQGCMVLQQEYILIQLPFADHYKAINDEGMPNFGKL